MIVPARLRSDELQDRREQGSCEGLGRTDEGKSLRFLVSAEVSFDRRHGSRVEQSLGDWRETGVEFKVGDRRR